MKVGRWNLMWKSLISNEIDPILTVRVEGCKNTTELLGLVSKIEETLKEFK